MAGNAGMYVPLPVDGEPFLISTGHLAWPQEVEALVRAAKGAGNIAAAFAAYQ